MIISNVFSQATLKILAKMLIMSFRAYRYFVNLDIFKIEASACFLDEKF